MQDQINSRPCVRCKAFKPQTEFHKEKSRPDGLRLECKACKKLARKLRRQREADVPPDHRKCKRCKNAKPLSEFRQRIVKAGRQKGQTRITTRCIGCCRLFEREDRKRNPEKYRARDRKRYLNNREQRRTAVYLYRIENPEKIRETRRKGWLKHKEKRSARHSEYWLANLDKLKAYARTWRKENPEKCRDLSNKRRARKLSAPGEYTQAEWKAIQRRFKSRCVCCGIRRRDTPEGRLTADHVVPLMGGGTNDISNIQPLCHSCNSRKGARHTADYRPAPFTGNGQLALVSFVVQPTGNVTVRG